MKIVVINGSARKGNTYTAVETFAKVAAETNEVEIIDAYKVNVAACKGCGACQCMNGCVDKDDTNMVVDKIVAADAIVFATPVYWWGINAQLKLIIDKCYCRGGVLKDKKVGTITIGADAVDSIQYKLISQQYECIAKYLSWDLVFQKGYSAADLKDLANNSEAIAELTELAKNM